VALAEPGAFGHEALEAAGTEQLPPAGQVVATQLIKHHQDQELGPSRLSLMPHGRLGGKSRARGGGGDQDKQEETLAAGGHGEARGGIVIIFLMLPCPLQAHKPRRAELRAMQLHLGKSM
jgi:hypothetical protein